MHTFFRGWRRKAGFVALVMACGLGLAWVRSKLVLDRIELPGSSMNFECHSYKGYLACTWGRGASRVREVTWTSTRAVRALGDAEVWKLNSSHANWNWGGVLAGVRKGEYSYMDHGKIRRGEFLTHFTVIFYWVLTFPLTVLSAYLILWTPGKRASGTPQS